MSDVGRLSEGTEYMCDPKNCQYLGERFQNTQILYLGTSTCMPLAACVDAPIGDYIGDFDDDTGDHDVALHKALFK